MMGSESNVECSTDALRGELVLRAVPVTQASFGAIDTGGDIRFSPVAA